MCLYVSSCEFMCVRSLARVSFAWTQAEAKAGKEAKRQRGDQAGQVK